MIKQNDINLLTELRKNARESLTNISSKINVPVSTLFDMLKSHHRKSFIHKHTTLVNFDRLGYNSRVNLTMRSPKENRASLENYLKLHPCVNNLYRINDGYDFQAEVIFANPKETQDFINEITEIFSIQDLHKHVVLEDLKREEFMVNDANINFNNSALQKEVSLKL